MRKVNLWPVAIISTFTIFIALIIVFVVFATRQKMELVSPDYYEDEMRFQEQIERLSRTSLLAARKLIAYDADRREIVITLPAVHSRHLSAGRVQLYRPSDASLDLHIELATDAEGVQRIETRQLRGGLWKIRLQWKVNGQEFFFDQPIVIPPCKT